jgi:hypothetical protein
MNRVPNWLVYSLVIVITVVWVVSFAASLIIRGYDPPESVNLLFSSFVGGLILQAASKRRDDDDDDADEKIKPKESAEDGTQ